MDRSKKRKLSAVPKSAVKDVSELEGASNSNLPAASSTTTATMQANGEDSKPSATNHGSEESQKAWKAVLDRIPRCTSAEGICETSCFRNQVQASSGGTKLCLRKLLHELGSLEDNLPTDPAIWVRFDEEIPQFMRVLITAPSDTPYAYGLFCFDLFVPENYPAVAPQMRLITTGGGTVRFSPNLYENGTVCLSLLGTWSGPKWNPLHSSILQVLVSVQGLILGVEHPYYLEPGFGGWGESTNKMPDKSGYVPGQVKVADFKIRLGTIKYAMLEMCRAESRPKYLAPFAEIIDAHFTHHRNSIIQQLTQWCNPNGLNLSMQTFKAKAAELKQILNQMPGATPPTKGSPVAAATNGFDGKKSVILVKQEAMEDAVKRGDYVTAGQLQTEIEYVRNRGVDAMIASHRKEMEESASRGDYINAGKLQHRVKYLEQHRHRLQELPRRMFQAAAQLDYTRAGRFQEQYQILLDAANDDPFAKSGPTAQAHPSAMWDQGFGLPPPPPHVAAGLFGSTAPSLLSAVGSILPYPMTQKQPEDNDGDDYLPEDLLSDPYKKGGMH